MRNQRFSERDVIDLLVEDLRRYLPDSWTVVPRTEVRVGAIDGRGRNWGLPDALVTITAPDGTSSTIVVEVKSRLDPKDVPRALAQARRLAGDDSVVIASSYLSPRTRELLIQTGAGFVDATGNLRVALERPAFFIQTSGASSDPRPNDRPLKSLRGPSAARAVRALCDFRPPFSVSALAQRSKTPLASLWRVVDLLDREALLTRVRRGDIQSVMWPAVIRRWTEDYSFMDSNRVSTYLEPRGLSELLKKLQTFSRSYSVTGSLAASQVAPVASPRLAAVYVENAKSAADELRLRPTEAGANVALAEPLDRVAFERTRERSGISYAALSQVAADLLTSPGRGPGEGEELIAWMEKNEDDWR